MFYFIISIGFLINSVLVGAHSYVSCTNTIVHNFGDIFTPETIPANFSCYGFARAYPAADFFQQKNTDVSLFADQGRQTYVWSNAWSNAGRTISQRQMTTNGIPAYFPEAPMARARPGDTIRLQITDPNIHSGPGDAGWTRIFWGGGVGKTLTRESQLTDDRMLVYQSWQRSFPHGTKNGGYYDTFFGYVDLPLVDTKGQPLAEGMHSFTYTWGDDYDTERFTNKNGQTIAARIGFVCVFEVYVDSKADPVKLLPWPQSAEKDLNVPKNPALNNQNHINITGSTDADVLTSKYGGIPPWKWAGYSADQNFGYKIPDPPTIEDTSTVYGLAGAIKFNGTTNVDNRATYNVSQFRYGQNGFSVVGNSNLESGTNLSQTGATSQISSNTTELSTPPSGPTPAATNKTTKRPGRHGCRL